MFSQFLVTMLLGSESEKCIGRIPQIKKLRNNVTHFANKTQLSKKKDTNRCKLDLECQCHSAQGTFVDSQPQTYDRPALPVA